ncbi:hypothetical protein H2203_008564 [Taxawa tesnikishii (nom. ined.)]|nr:hypothetical protein H2203_008564 [Dothideales sp. JES 119]
MADLDDENYFSDNGFDELPVNTLQDLEQRAVLSTQQETAIGIRQPFHQQKAQKTANGNNAWHDRQTATVVAPGSFTEPPSSDYGLDDEDVIDLDEPSLVIQPASGPPARAPRNAVPVHAHREAQPGAEDSFRSAYSQQEAAPAGGYAGPDFDVSELEARIQELERERNNLKKSLEDAKSAASVKTGEISIVRANHDKAAKEYERRIAVMHKLHAEDAIRHKAELEAARKDTEKAETSNRFLEHDLAQETERAKRRKGPLENDRTRRGTTVSPTVTPRKNRTLPYRGDGFDDHEIVSVSPSRSKERAETPKAGTKRKRPSHASPGSPLPLSIPRPTVAPDTNAQIQDTTADYGLPPSQKYDVSFETMQLMLNHRPYSGHDRTVEALARHAFPSSSETSLSSLMFDKLSAPVNDVAMSLRISNVMLDLWGKCLEEKHFAPLYLTVDMIYFMVISQAESLMAALAERFIPMATKTIVLVALPLYYASTSPTMTAEVDSTTQARFNNEICAEYILELLHNMAMEASSDLENTRSFWQKMDYGFVLLMLNIAQPVSQITLTLQMMATSTLSNSFGTIAPDSEKQLENERHFLDRMTTLLFESPKVPEDEQPYSDSEVANLRVETISALSAIAAKTYGSISMAQHRHVIGRLFRFLHLQINSLYDMPLNPSDIVVVATTEPSVHSLTIATINITTRLLYQLLHNHADLINLREKLAVIHGGHHKFLVSLTRLAFSEQMVFEAGIEEEVLDAANEILDAVLSPEEGEAVIAAVQTPRGTHGTRSTAPG